MEQTGERRRRRRRRRGQVEDLNDYEMGGWHVFMAFR